MPAPPRETARPLAGRRIVVTGATSGIGEATVRALCQEGAEVAVVGRDRRKVDATVAFLAREGHLATGFVADLTDREAVRRLAIELNARYPALDALINNAGAIFFEREETRSGSERTFALNVEAPFLLTELLLVPLRRSGRGRVVNVSSAAHTAGRIHFDDLDLRRSFSGWKAYSQSKLALLLLTREASRVHAGTNVTFNACHPGLIRSRFAAEGRGLMPRTFHTLLWLFGRSPTAGARTPVYLAAREEVASRSGEYFARMRPRRSSSRSLRDDDARRLWGIVSSRTGLSTAVATPP